MVRVLLVAIFLSACQDISDPDRDASVHKTYNDVLWPSPDKYVPMCGDGFCDPEVEDMISCWADCRPLPINPNPEVGPGPGHPKPGPYRNLEAP